MAEVNDPQDQNSPAANLDAPASGTTAAGQPSTAPAEPRGIKRQRPSQPAPDDDDDDDDKPGRERRKIDIKFIQDKSRRHITFSKRKAGIMKKTHGTHDHELEMLASRLCSTEADLYKAYELSVLTGTQVLLLVVSETGLVYTFTTPKLQPLVTKPEGKNLIQQCLNAPEPPSENQNGVEGDEQGASPEDVAHPPPPQSAASMPRNNGIAPYAALTPEQQQQMVYQQYMQQQQQNNVGYPLPPQT